MDGATKSFCLYLSICALMCCHSVLSYNPFITQMTEWTQLEFDYASEQARQNAINSGEFNVGYLPPIDIDIYYNDANVRTKAFVTVPRFQNGVPATLGTITDRSYYGNPIIAPYPSWAWHKNLNACAQNRIVSVFRVKIDECGRLWVLDTGRIVDTQICPAQILAFDLKTDTLIHRYEIPANQIQSNSILVTPIVDVRDPPPYGKCQDTFVYAADCQAMALIVHNVKKNNSWRVIDKTMYPYPSYGTYYIAGQQFDLMDGILSMDLSPYKPGVSKDRTLFFHALASGTENWVYTSYLRNQTLFENNPSPAPQIFHTYQGTRHTQAAAQAIDRDGISYFGLASDISINCWNTALPYGDNYIRVLDQDNKALQFASGMKVITNKLGVQELWFLTMRFQKVATGTLNPREVNFRVFAARITDLTGYDKCRVV